jgi:hypothetical protein
MAKMSAFVAENSLNFPQFRKTSRAHEALNRRDRQLSSRLRHLLLLIDRSDTASRGLRQSLMTQENLDALLRLSLIEPIEPAATEQSAPIDRVEAVTDTMPALRVVLDQPAQPLADHLDPEPISTAALIAEFEQAVQQAEYQEQHASQYQTQPQHAQVQTVLAMVEVQQLMIQSLRQACGLLAAGLMREIDAAQSIDQLHRCQGRWKMTLLDSRFDRGQIDQWIDQVSLSIRSH